MVLGSFSGNVKKGATVFTAVYKLLAKARPGPQSFTCILPVYGRSLRRECATIRPFPKKHNKRRRAGARPDLEENIMKKITRRSFLAICGTVAAAAALTACGGSASSATASTASSAAGSTAAGTLSGNVATGGSTSMKNVIAALTEGFAEVEPGVTVSYDPTGSGAGITGATDKTLDIGLSSRALKDDEKNDVDGTTVALDGIAIIVNKDSKVADLTVDQLKQMFTGEITNWSEVGGDDGEIVLIGREAGSGTRDGFESIVDVKDSCKYAQELTATGAVISAVEANPLAIGYASLSAVGDTVAMVTVEGVACSEDTVKDGSYKIQRPFVFVTNKSVTLSEQAQAFVDFATSKDAADLIRTAGAVPVNE